MKSLIQVRYRFAGVRIKPGVSERLAIEKIWQQFKTTGKTPPGVTITVLDWFRGPLTWRECRTLAVGCPGRVKRYHKRNLTMCDYDQDEPISLVKIWSEAARLGLRPRWVAYDRTARGWHVTIEWNKNLSPGETVALQLLFGSDIERERFNLARVIQGRAGRNPRWNLEFEYKLQ